MTSFQDKQLRVTFALNGQVTAALVEEGSALTGTTNQIVLTGLRTCATITGALSFLTQLDLQVYGMLPQDMNALSVITGVKGFPMAIAQNTVLLEANNGDGNWATVFNGLIIEAGPEYRNMPEVFFHVQAVVSPAFTGMQPATPLSYPAGVSITVAIDTIAASMGILALNEGVTATLPIGHYRPGSPLDQLRQLADASGQFDWTIDASNTLVIMPRNQPRQTPSGITLSPQNGLVGYPTIETLGIGVVALFNPAFLLSSQFTITGSDIPAANGTWMPIQIQHQLESVKFGGQWHTAMQCIQPGSLQ